MGYRDRPTPRSLVIDNLITYLLHIAPSLAVVIVLLYQQSRRMATMEQRIEDILSKCVDGILEHINRD